MNPPTIETAKKILSLLKHGLVRGLGQPKPGEMCVEAAVCFALGLPHGDNPPCVSQAVRSFKVALNDSTSWSSNESRAHGLRRLAIAQLGSDSVDSKQFVHDMTLVTIQKIVPIALRASARLNVKQASALEKHAIVCEQALTLENARAAAASAAASAASASAYAYASAAAYAYASAAAAASAYAAASAAYASAAYASAAYASAAAASSASASASASAAYASAAAAASAAASASAAAAAYAAACDKVLCEAAELAVQVLVKLNSPGCAWLYLAPIE